MSKGIFQRAFILLGVIVWLTPSCEDCQHSEFNRDNPIYNWSLFPGFPDSISFKNDFFTNTATFHFQDSSHYYSSGSYQLEPQGKCQDYTYVSTTRYSSSDFGDIEEHFYFDPKDELEGTIFFMMNYFQGNYGRSGNGLEAVNYSDYAISFLDTFTYYGTTYTNLVSFQYSDALASGFSRLLVKEHYGLIGFTYSNWDWVKI